MSHIFTQKHRVLVCWRREEDSNHKGDFKIIRKILTILHFQSPKNPQTAFFVTLYNLNYKSNDKNGKVNGKVSGKVNAKVKFSEKELSVLSALQENGDLTIKHLITKLGISQRTISRILLKLKDKGLIERIGSDKSGYWKVK